VNPSATAKVIRLLGRVGGVEALAHLTFSDREADKAPTFEDARHTVYINYPESMLPDIEKILVNPGRVLCQIYFIDKVTVWATVESPVIERK